MAYAQEVNPGPMCHREDPGQVSSKPSDSGAGRLEDSEDLLLETGAVDVNLAVCLRDFTLIQVYIYKELREFPSELSSEVLNGLTMDELAMKDIQDTEIAMLVKWSLSDPTFVGSEINGVPLPPCKMSVHKSAVQGILGRSSSLKTT